MPENKKLNLFLKETFYCDYNNPNIQKIVKDFSEKYPDKRDLARAYFYLVRDGILYRVGLWQKKASETLSEKSGTCTNKANLLVALLRASKIPAGYGKMKVNGRDYFGPIVTPFLREVISRESVHIYAYVYLFQRWIKIDPSDDKQFSEKTSYFNLQSKLVEWDGNNDANLNLNPSHIIFDEGPLYDIDDIISKKNKTASKFIVKMGNIYIKFLRQNNQKIESQKHLHIIFRNWMIFNHPITYIIFSLNSFIYRILSKIKILKY